MAMLLWPIVEWLALTLSKPYSPFEVVWVRYGVHLMLMLALWTPGGPARLVRTRRPGLHVIRALTMLGMPACFVLAITRMPLDAVMSLFWISPLMAMLLAAMWLGDRPGWAPVDVVCCSLRGRPVRPGALRPHAALGLDPPAAHGRVLRAVSCADATHAG